MALFIYLQPPIATGLSVAFLGEQLTLRFAVAALGIFAGVYLAVTARSGGETRAAEVEVARRTLEGEVS